MQLLVCVIKSRAKQRASLEILITKSRDSGRLLLLPHWVCYRDGCNFKQFATIASATNCETVKDYLVSFLLSASPPPSIHGYARYVCTHLFT